MTLMDERMGLRPALVRRAVGVLGIGTAVPGGVTQAEAARLAEGFACSSDRERAWVRRVFARAGVERRGTVLMDGAGGVEGFYPARAGEGDRGPTTAARMARYAAEAPVLGERACLAALKESGVAAGEITHLITVSCTGFSAPGVDVGLVERLGLLPSVRRTHIGFMGCHAAFNALGAAQDAVLANPGARVLVCCVELTSLHFQYGFDAEKLVANALFADGAAACVVGAAEGEGGIELVHATSLLLPDSKEAMTWKIGDHGFEMTLSSVLPGLIGGSVRPWCEGWLGELGLTVGEVGKWAIHPGGPKILDAARDALGIGEEAVAGSRAVLAAHGNMSSATILFLLRRMAAEARGGEREWCVAMGFGPGLMAEGLLLRM